MCCNRFSSCSCLGLIVSIILGAIVGILFAFELIPNIVTSVWIAFGLGVLSLVFLVIGVIAGGITEPNALSRCLCKNIVCLLIGIIGTIVLTLVALSIELNPAFELVAAIVALGTTFFSILLIALIDLIVCFLCKFCCRNQA